ncbi:MAG: phosphomannomutase/phosphoglucomutase [Nitrospinota bacterium]
MVNPQIFREYDIRGVVDRDLTPEVVFDLGRALGAYLGGERGARVALGHDNRTSSELFRDRLAEGLMASGCHVIGVGLVPTPILYFAIYEFGAEGGVMITGSHNPPEYNGFKVCKGKDPIYGPQIQEVRRLIEKGAYPKPRGPGALEERDARGPYVEFLLGKLKFERPLRVVVDAGNGVGGLVGPYRMGKMGAEVRELFCEPDASYPHHHPDPLVPENLSFLIEEVKRWGAEVGVAYDGDADRIGVVDERGKIVWADELLILYAREVLAERPGSTIVFDVKCSVNLVSEIERLGGKPLMWKTGHSLIRQKLRQEGAPLGGELSGHMFFADDYFGYDDAIYASLRLLRLLASGEVPLSERLKGLPPTVATPEFRIECPDEEKFGVVEAIQAHFRELYPTVEVDGARVDFGEGWSLVRASNTQPALVLRFEADSEAALSRIQKEVWKKLREFPAVRVPDA